MFSIAAINDTDSLEQWEPLAPTKEAKEFHLTQAYHEGLLKLEAKEYDKAQELLESVLKDPLISDSQVDSDASDGHLLQLRFLALKNLANVFLEQGPTRYEDALKCYLQAVEIDTKDSVVWNQLGTLSCSMGSLSISRWAFEQGLLCSPNNWNCMEKLLEVLIAIGDEVACLSVAELILQHWPSHPRALHVKNTIEMPEPIPFAPRGIDKLEPRHVRLKFPAKRKAIDQSIGKDVAAKKPSNEIELFLPEVSWAALTDAILDILLPLNVCASNRDSENVYRSGDIRLKVHLPSTDVASGPVEKKIELCDESITVGGCNVERANDYRDTNSLDGHPHERRSTRLENLRSRKPDKEELDFGSSTDLVKDVLQLVEPFLVDKTVRQDSDHMVCSGTTYPDIACSLEKERDNVFTFVRETSKNYGAYHLGHLLLEHAACGSLLYHDAFAKFLQLEKLTRSWGQDRTPECSLFLAELYYDLGSLPCNSSQLTEFISESSYHLCKIIESVALGYPFHMTHMSWKQTFSSSNRSLHGETTSDEELSFHDALAKGSFTINKRTFWIRYFWLCGRLSLLDGNRTKAHEEFCISLSLMEKTETTDNSQCSVQLPHLKINKEITKSKILYEVNMQNVDFLLEKTVGGMIEKEMYVECINLLSPLIFSMEDVDLDGSPLLVPHHIDEKFTYTELSALDILINACEKTNLKDSDIHLNCHQRKLKLLMILAGMDANGPSRQKLSVKSLSPLDVYGKEALEKDWEEFVAVEVKAISQCVSLLKDVSGQSNDLNSAIIPSPSISNIQSLLLTFMCHLAINHLGKKSPVVIVADGIDQKQRSSFVDACIAFCKLQHLIVTIPVKTQVQLIVATHNLLAKYGICCSGGIDGEEGLFLKFAIKHLLALDMKLKSNLNSSSQQLGQQNKQSSLDTENETAQDEPKSDELDLKMSGAEADQNSVFDNPVIGGITTDIRTFQTKAQESAGLEYNKQCCEGGRNVEQPTAQSTEHEDELSEDEREELELSIENALDQCFFCLYGLNLRSDASYEDDLAMHKNTSRGDYQTKEQCADVFQYIFPYAKASTRTGLIKLRRVLRAIRKHFPQPPEAVLTRNAINNFLDDPDLCEDKLSEEAGCDGFLETITNALFPHGGGVNDHRILIAGSSEPYLEVYSNLYYFLALSEEMNATDKWTGFVLTKEGEEFVEQNANLFKYDLLYNPLRFESWQRLATIYDEEVDLLLNDGSKHINVAGWRKNATLPQRVDASRRRSRRCLLMSLALAKASAQQCEIHELLALVYYDSLQNVVPFYDQRSVVPTKNVAWTLCCENSLRHFKKAFLHKEDWSHAFYMGKLCEKLGYAYETSLRYYDKAISLNPSAVDPFYRMHASRIKLLCAHGQQNLKALKVLSQYSYSQVVKDAVVTTFGKVSSNGSPETGDMNNSEITSHDMLEVWHMLYKDCLSALEICIEGDLKHFHKARFMLAQGLYKRGLSGDLGRAKEELSFCFKSSRSSFTINMWEIDGLVKKGRRKTPGVSGSKKVLEVNLPESSRKFITCIRKYLILYLKLLEETGDVGTLERAFVSLRADKRFSLCVEDLVPMALGRHIKTLVSSMHQEDSSLAGSPDSLKHQLEKIFSLFLEQGSLWPEVLTLPEITSPEMSEKNLYGYLHQYIALLESNGKLDTLEAIQEKIRKRFKNPKLSNSSCAKVCRHASIAWCRYLIINLAMITPHQAPAVACNLSDSSLENSHLLCVDLEANELWSSSSEEITRSEHLESKWAHVLSKMKRIVIRKVSRENFETANCLLRSSYSFYKESSCASLPSGVNLYLVPSRFAMETQFQLGLDGVEVLDVSIPRKLLLWAYALLHGRYVNISTVVKYCEENVKPKVRKGAASPAITPSPSTTSKDSATHGGSREPEAAPPSIEAENAVNLNSPLPPSTTIGPSSNIAAETTPTMQKGG